MLLHQNSAQYTLTSIKCNVKTSKGNDKHKMTMLTMKYSHEHVKDYHQDMDIILDNLSVSIHDANLKKYIGVVIFHAYYVRKGNIELGHRLGFDVEEYLLRFTTYNEISGGIIY